MIKFNFGNGNTEVLDTEYANKFIEFMYSNDGQQYKVVGNEIHIDEFEYDYWIDMFDMKRELEAMFEELSYEDQQEVDEQFMFYTTSDIEEELKIYKSLVKERL